MHRDFRMDIIYKGILARHLVNRYYAYGTHCTRDATVTDHIEVYLGLVLLILVIPKYFS